MITPVERVLQDAALDMGTIREDVLVVGSMPIPTVLRLLVASLNMTENKKSMDLIS